MASPAQSARVSHSDNNNASNPRPTYNPQNSNIRPRNRRLITAEQELAETSSLSSGLGIPGSEPNTRSNSPIPAKYPNRTATKEGRSNGRLGAGYAYGASDNNSAKTTAGFGKGFFEGGWTGSWSTLQELAREVLGTGDETSHSAAQNGVQRNKRSASAGGGMGGRKGKGPESWGPEGGLPRKRDDSIGAGSLAAREAEVRTRKMKSALESYEGVNGGLDVLGRHKRRTSLDDPAGADEECDAMVYVHHVQPSDTQAGVVLKYNCNPAIFRKANGFWPNDSIQVKKVVLLPVDACSIKGRPCEPPSKKPSQKQDIDLLAPTPIYEDIPINTNARNGRLDPSEEDDSMAGSSSPVLQKPEEDQPWTHVRWVMLFPSPNQPTEIARLPRKTLGYFPPPRRKSITSGSTVSSPRGSFDLPSRVSTSFSSTDRDLGSASSTPPRRISNLAPRSQQSNGSSFPPSTSVPPGPRREVMSSAIYRRGSIGADAARLSWMRGPGGVGTLSGRKIGAGNDGLNKWAKKHLPGLAIDNLPSTSITGAETANFGFDGAEEPKQTLFSGAPSVRSGSSTPAQDASAGNGLGLENAAAAIEGWVRRLAIKNPSPATPQTGPNNRLAPLNDGDLIELLDGASSDDGRGFEPLRSNDGPRSLGMSGSSRSGREDLEGAIRGRGSSYVGKAGKSD